MPYLFFVMICLIWSSSFILMKKAAIAFSPVSIGWWRVFWGAAVLLLLCWQRGLLQWPQKRHWPALMVVALLGCAAPYVVQPVVVNHQGGAFMAMAVSCVPLLTIVFSIPMLGTYPSRCQLFGVCAAFGCMGLLLFDGLKRQIPLSDFGLAVTVPLGYAITNTVIRRWLSDLPALLLTCLSLAMSTLLLTPFAFRDPVSTTEQWLWASGGLMILGVLGTGLAMFWFNRLVQDHGPLFAGMTTNIVPIGAVLWGWIDQEAITQRQLFALGGILFAVACVQYRAAAKPA